MPYVIRRNEDGAFVAFDGPASYVRRLQDARQFATRESAEREKCGNETVVPLEDAMRTPKGD